MVRAVLFDMDGLLIDSERIYTDVVNELLKPYGKEQTWDIKARLMGKPERDATLVLLSSLWPPNPDHPQDVERGFSHECPFTLDDFLQKRNALLLPAFERVPPMPGAERLVQHLAQHQIPICVVAESTVRTMLLTRHQDQVKARANPRIFDVFGDRVICGDDDIVGRGKPTPDIFLIAAKHGLGIHNTDEGRAFLEGIRNPGAEFDDRLAGHEGDVLVFEDAVPGVQAGLAAGMKGTCSCAYSTVVWVPDANVSKGISNFQLRAVTDQGPPVGAHQQIGSLLEFRPEEWGLPPFEDA